MMFSVDEFKHFSYLACLPEGKLIEALSEKQYPAVLELLRQQTEPIKDFSAGLCLTAALSCPLSIFRMVLNACLPVEYANRSVNMQPDDARFSVNVSGTLLTIAAAMGSTEHAAILLEHGYDCNSISFASAQAIISSVPPWSFPDPSFSDTCGLTGSSLQYYRLDKQNRRRQTARLRCCTPLAAAMICGHVETVELLLAQPGIITVQSSAVCQAALLCADGTSKQQLCVQKVFGLSNPAALLREQPFPPDLLVYESSEAQMKCWLSGPFATEEGARTFLKTIQKHRFIKLIRAPEYKLLALAKAFPTLCREPWAAGQFLRVYLALRSAKHPRTRLLECWKRLCGSDRDLSWANEELSVLNAQELRKACRLLGDGGSLWAYAECLTGVFTNRDLSVLVQNVQIRRCLTQGVSAFADHIVQSADLRLVKSAIRNNVFAHEPKRELLAILRDQNPNPMLRTMLLSLPKAECAAAPNRQDLPASQDLPLYRYWSAEQAQRSREDSNAWLAQMWTEPIPQDECLRRLCIAQNDTGFQGDIFYHDFFGWEEPDSSAQVGDITVYDYLSAACCGQNPELLKTLLEHSHSPLRRLSMARFSLPNSLEKTQIEGTPLCLAAAAGRIEQVRILLEKGFDPNEEDCTCRSSTHWRLSRTNITPLIAAKLFGHAEIAQLLLAAGAKPYPMPESLHPECE